MPVAPESPEVSSSEPPAAGSRTTICVVKRRGYELALTAAIPFPNGQRWEQTSLQAHLRGRADSSAIVLNGKELEAFSMDVQTLLEYLRWERAKRKAVRAARRPAAARKERKQPRKNRRVRGSQEGKANQNARAAPQVDKPTRSTKSHTTPMGQESTR
jgi:hypothetical protein